MTPDFYNALSTLAPCSPDISAREAWEAIRPDKGPFLRNSFWYALSRSLPFARSAERQKKIADFIFDWQIRSEKAGQSWPPKPILTKPVILPAPNTLKT